MAKFHVSFRDLSDSIIVSAADVQTDAFGSYVFLDEGERVAVLPVEVVKSILEEEHRRFPDPPSPFKSEITEVDQDGQVSGPAIAGPIREGEVSGDTSPAGTDVGLPDPPAEDQGAKIG